MELHSDNNNTSMTMSVIAGDVSKSEKENKEKAFETYINELEKGKSLLRIYTEME